MTEQVSKNNIPKVSIGMPVYNGEKFIRDAINSLLAQTFTDFELIISDNCSTDDTGSICQEYANIDSRIKYIRQPLNMGAIANFEYVLHVSQSDYFMWAACDDVWSADWLFKLYRMLISSESGAVFGQVLPVNAKLKLSKHIAVGRHFKFTGNIFFRRLSFYLQFEGKGKANLFYSLFRKDKILRLKLNLFTYDYSVIYHLLANCGFESVKNIFLYKRDHPAAAGNLMNKNNKILFRIFRLLIPIPMNLLAEYLKHASVLEKVIMILFLPIKYLLAYICIFQSLMIRRFS